VAARRKWALDRILILVKITCVGLGLPTAAGGDGAGVGAMGLGIPLASHGWASRLKPGESVPCLSGQVAGEPSEVGPSANNILLHPRCSRVKFFEHTLA